MEKDIVEGKIGEVGAYDLEFKGGKLVLKVNAAKADVGVTAGLHIEVSANVVLDAIAAKIPGKIDDAFLNIIKTALAV